MVDGRFRGRNALVIWRDGESLSTSSGRAPTEAEAVGSVFGEGSPVPQTGFVLDTLVSTIDHGV